MAVCLDNEEMCMGDKTPLFSVSNHHVADGGKSPYIDGGESPPHIRRIEQYPFVLKRTI
jgi:hypothetical protein